MNHENTKSGSPSRRAWMGWSVAGGMLLAAACSSGLGEFTIGGTTPAAEPAPVETTVFGFAPGVTLTDPVTGQPEQPRDGQYGSITVGGVGALGLYAFTTDADADDADGAGNPLDPEAPLDGNSADDVFLSVLDADGDVLDTILVSRNNSGAAANAASARPSIAFVESTSFDSGNPAGTNPAGRIFVAFDSQASDLGGGDSNGRRDVFRAVVELRVDEDPATGAASPGGLNLAFDSTFRVTFSATSGSGPDGDSTNASIAINRSGAGDGDFDGFYVAFESTATDILSTFTNGNGSQPDVYLREFPPAPPSGHTSNPNCSGCHCWDGSSWLLSRATTGPTTGGNGGSFNPRVVEAVDGFAVSVQGVTYESEASDLVAGDSNGDRDIFLFDIACFGVGSSPRRVSVATGGLEGSGGDSRNASVFIVDQDARDFLVAFESDKDDLVAATPPMTTTNVYLHDTRSGGTTTILNRRIGPGGASGGTAQGGAAPADAFRPVFARDGSGVVFDTLADDLDVYGPDTNRASDVVLADLERFESDGEIRHVRLSGRSGGAGADAFGGGLTRFSGSATVATGANGQPEAFSEGLLGKALHPRCINCHGMNSPSPTSPGSTMPNHNVGTNCEGCHAPSFTGVADWRAPGPAFDFRGKTAAELCEMFSTPLPGLTVREHLEHDDKILWALGNGSTVNVPDNQGGSTTRPSVPGGRQQWLDMVDDWIDGGQKCSAPGAAGGIVARYSAQTSPGGAPEERFVVLREAPVERVSKRSGFTPTAGTLQLGVGSRAPSISDDGRWVAFVTAAAIDPRDQNGADDVYVRDLFFGTTTLVSHASGGSRSANGASRAPSIASGPGVVAVAFESGARDLVSGFSDGNGAGTDVYLATLSAFDPATPASIPIVLVSRVNGTLTEGADGRSAAPSLSLGAGVPFVAYESTASDVLASFTDNNGSDPDVFLWREPPFVASLASFAGSTSNGGNGASTQPSLNTAGTHVAFTSAATDLRPGFVDGNGPDGTDVYSSDGMLVTLLSRSTAGASLGANGSSSRPSVDDDGGSVTVAYESLATDLVFGFVDANGPAAGDVYFQDFGGAPALASASFGAPGTGGDGPSGRPRVARGGDSIVFGSTASDLVDPGVDADANGVHDVFVLDRLAGSVLRRSRGIGGAEANGASRRPDVAAANGRVVFETDATNLVGPNVDTNGATDVYRRDP